MQAIVKLFFLACLSLLSISIYAQATGGATFNGTYKCQGYDPYSKANYQFPTVVFTKNGDNYQIQYQDNQGNPVKYGTGVTLADSNNILSVITWPLKKNFYMVSVYKLQPDGTLTSSWATEGQSQAGSETCMKV